MKKPRKFNRRLASKIMAGTIWGYIKTRDGRPVRIVAWDAKGAMSIVGLIYMGDLDAELSWQWTKQGIAFGHDDSSTINHNLVIELQEKSTVPRLRRGPNKKRK